MLDIRCSPLLHLYHCIFRLPGTIQLVCDPQLRRSHRLKLQLSWPENFFALEIDALMIKG